MRALVALASLRVFGVGLELDSWGLGFTGLGF